MRTLYFSHRQGAAPPFQRPLRDLTQLAHCVEIRSSCSLLARETVLSEYIERDERTDALRSMPLELEHKPHRSIFRSFGKASDTSTMMGVWQAQLLV